MQNESFLIRWLSKMGPICALSLIWLLLCLPVVTIIPACISLYDCVVHCLHGNEEGPIRRFFRTLKAELLRGILLSVVFLAMWFLLAAGYRITAAFATGTLATVYSMVYAGSMLIPFGIWVWIVPIQARFRYSFGELLSTSIAMAFTHLPTTAASIGLLLASFVIMFCLPPMLVMVPAICATIQAHWIEKVFSQYIMEDAPEAIEK